LLQIQAERLRRLQSLAKQKFGKSVSIPWFASGVFDFFGELVQRYIMTSEATDELTEQFFATNKFFGLDPNSVRFFEQGRYPSLLENGKIAMSSRCGISLSPNGNGGIYEAVHRFQNISSFVFLVCLKLV
jgi:UDP-N-acetylglucosamine/UDP-N-acetylgalactosamine diphosphorylase